MTRNEPAAIRAALRADLTVAMKARHRERVAALRSTIAAIDNAEAVDTEPVDQPSSQHIAGAAAGIGSTEAARRELTADDVRGIIRTEIDDRITQAAHYDELDRPDTAAKLRAEAATLTQYLA